MPGRPEFEATEHAAEAQAGRLEPLPFPGVFAFVGSGCLLVLEIVAGRILAPEVGVSLYTWTSVIGVVLAGLSLGNWIGGRLADQYPGRTTLSYLYVGSAASTALILLFARDLESVSAPNDWTAILQVLWLAGLVFFLPSVLLGTETPMIVKLSLASLDATGRVVGRVQAAATMGSILGVFLTGFFLISWFGTRAIVAGVAVVLVLLAILSHPQLSSPRRFAAALRGRAVAPLLVLAVLVGTAGLAVASDDKCLRESNYFCIHIGNQLGARALYLDLLVHGRVKLGDPTALVYDYERLYDAAIKSVFKPEDRLRTFTIGGGTYAFPRYLDVTRPSHNVVAEIDPEVTEVARSHFGLTDSPGIEIVHQDARLALEQRPEDEIYDVVIGDAFNDLAVPYHLTTREFNELVADHLTPRGLYLANVIDGVDYDFLRSYVKTMGLTFPGVGVILLSPGAFSGLRSTFVVVASRRPLPQIPGMLPQPLLQQFLEKDATILTDDHVPVDQLLAPVFRQRVSQGL